MKDLDRERTQPDSSRVEDLSDGTVPDRFSGLLAPILAPLGVAVVAGAIGIITWVVQYVPDEDSKIQREPEPLRAKPALLFKVTTGVWDPQDPEYAKEIEGNVPGHFDFPFQNVSADPAELGLLATSCDCTYLEVALLSPQEWSELEQARDRPASQEAASPQQTFSWQRLELNGTHGVVVPPKARGLVRMCWRGREGAREPMRMRAGLWIQPQGKMEHRQFVNLEVPIILVSPVMCHKGTADLGSLRPAFTARAEFLCWSPTRSSPDLGIANDDPLFHWTLSPLFTSAECELLQKQLVHQGVHTRVRAAFRVSVAVHDCKDGKQLEQGPFQRSAPLLVDGQQVDVATVKGLVRGDVEVEGTDDRGTIHLQDFDVRDGVARQVELWSKHGVALQLVGSAPPFLKARLRENHGKSTTKKTNWLVDITISAGCPSGALPEDSGVLIRAEGAAPRGLRIPVLGRATQR